MADEGRVMVTDEMVDRAWEVYCMEKSAGLTGDGPMRSALSAVLPAALARARREALEEVAAPFDARVEEMEKGRQRAASRGEKVSGWIVERDRAKAEAARIRALASQPQKEQANG